MYSVMMNLDKGERMSENKEFAESLSPFELSLFLEKKIHEKNQNIENWLNAGRGNPNWTAPTPREAFFLLGQFAVQETLIDENRATAGMVSESETRAERFLAFLTQHSGKGREFLINIWNDGNDYLGMEKTEWLDQILDAIIGDNYPNPANCLSACEPAIKAYLNQELFSDQAKPFDIFAVEGGTAGICYLFDTLINNFLLKKGDKIALMLPTFAPYLELTELAHYDFEVVKITAEQTQLDEKNSCQFSEEEIDKLKDTSIKAVFVVNPSNPTANAICYSTMKQIKKIVLNDNPKLMIITDDVYGTFVDDFHSLFAELPFNTACIYSYSKYFGATGWRIGTIAVSHENLFDQLLHQQSSDQKKQLQKRYCSLKSNVEELTFIDRLVADSRDIALNHTAGLSSAQQVMMTLFSLYALLDKGKNYKQEVMNICRSREKLLYQTLDLEEPLEELNTSYYCEINFKEWLEKRYGREFSEYFKNDWTVTKFLTSLAEEEQLMLLRTNDFGSDDWSIRISLANLSTSQYKEVGKRIIHLADTIQKKWLENKDKSAKVITVKKNLAE